MFQSLQSRNFRLFFIGQGYSLIGTWMQYTSMMWIVYAQSQSVFTLGLFLFSGQLPTALLSPLGGLIADRCNKHRVFFCTQIASLVQAGLLFAALLNHANIAVLFGLNILLGCINAIDIPTRHAQIAHLSGPQHLSNAIALNAAITNMGRIIGPSIAGIFLIMVGPQNCVLVNLLSYVPLLVCILKMRPEKKVAVENPMPSKTSWMDGLKYVQKNPAIAAVLVIMLLINLLITPYVNLLPKYVTDFFYGNPENFGLLEAFIGIGAILASLYHALLCNVINRRRVLKISLFMLGISLVAFSHSTSLLRSLLLIMISGFSFTSVTTSLMTMLQSRVDPRLRGRVLSYSTMIKYTMEPCGNFLTGLSAQHIGICRLTGLEGVAALIILAVFHKFLSPKAKLSVPLELLQLPKEASN